MRRPATRSRSLADRDADTPAEPAQCAVHSGCPGGMVRVQHSPHFAFADPEVAGEPALRDAGLAERFVEGGFQRDQDRRNDERSPCGRSRWCREVLAIAHRGGDQLAQQVPRLAQRLVPGPTLTPKGSPNDNAAMVSCIEWPTRRRPANPGSTLTKVNEERDAQSPPAKEHRATARLDRTKADTSPTADQLPQYVNYTTVAVSTNADPSCRSEPRTVRIVHIAAHR